MPAQRGRGLPLPRREVQLALRLSLSLSLTLILTLTQAGGDSWRDQLIATIKDNIQINVREP